MKRMLAKDLMIDLGIRYGFQILGAIVIVGVGALLARWAGTVTQRWLERRAMEPPVRILVVRAVRLLVLSFALVVALDKFGFQVAPLVAGIGVAGIGIGLALQGVLRNLVAGLTIIITKPFRVGDYLELLGVQGEVGSIELFSTALIHADRSRVIIPNRKIVGEILHNFGRMRQLTLTVGVAHDADLGEILALTEEIVRGNRRVLKEPPPGVGISAWADSGIKIAIQPWVSVPDYADAQAELYRTIIERFRARNIVLPVPRQDVRLLNGQGRPA